MGHCLPLFDIDATLLLTSGAGMRSMIQAGKDVLGPTLSWDGIEASGGLDPLLFALARGMRGMDTPGDETPPMEDR